MDPRTRFDKARSILLRDFPFWGSLVMNLRVKEDATVTQTMATDGVFIWYNPDYVANQDVNILVADVAHEGGGHVGFFHHLRRKGRDPQLWNIAADYEVNCYLKDSGITIGDDFLFDPRFRGMAVEKIYNILHREGGKPKGMKGCGGLHDHPSQGKPNGNGTGDNGKKGSAPGKGVTGPGKPDSSPGQQQAAASQAIAESDIRLKLAKARAFAKAAGKLPGTLDIAVEGILNPRATLVQILQHFLERCVAEDYTWQTPSRHHLHLGLYLPALESEAVMEMVFVVDSSASINQETYNHFAAELSGVVSLLPIEKVHVLHCDTQVKSAVEYTRADLPITISGKGRGGTNFKPPFVWLEERSIHPKCLVYLTDLECRSFPEQPSYPVLWAASGKRQTTPPFGEVVQLEE